MFHYTCYPRHVLLAFSPEAILFEKIISLVASWYQSSLPSQLSTYLEKPSKEERVEIGIRSCWTKLGAFVKTASVQTLLLTCFPRRRTPTSTPPISVGV